jgi:curved DNA-binding protein CbpA
MLTYNEFKEAVETLGLLSLSTKDDAKQRYLLLSKQFHPDNGGDKEQFLKINKAYNIIKTYIDNFRFSFDKDEFNKQFPFEIEKELLWIDNNKKTTN